MKDLSLDYIAVSFPLEPILGEIELICSNIKDVEAREETLPFLGKRWDEVNPVQFWDNFACISFFTPQAFKYYLAALIKCSLEDYELTSLCVSKLLSNLDSDFLGDLASWQYEYWILFSEDQLDLIRKWFAKLEVLDINLDFQKALKKARTAVDQKSWLGWL